jgi:outer membrane protein OmpA-like peptidoglycan-associated protein
MNSTRLGITLFFLCVSVQFASAQDTLFYDTLIRSQAGDFLIIKQESEITGLTDTFKLKNGTWDYYGKDGNLLKRARYRAIGGLQVFERQGVTTYYDLEGKPVLDRTYASDEVVEDKAYQQKIIIEGTAMLNIVEQYGELVVFEHLNRFRVPKIKTEYTNLRDKNELSYYLPTERRLASPHLLDTAQFWPNNTQNLIQNPMFEDHPKLPTSKASVNKDEVSHWEPVSPTPDFFLSEDCKSGTGCMGFRVYSLVKDIEYLQNKLVKPLKKDSVYCFSVYVKLANQCAYTSNGLGVHFSKKPIRDINEVIDSKPNLLLNESYLPYKTQWMLLQCSYKAKGGEKYATIGSFKQLNDIALTPVNGYAAEAYYIIDDVALIPVSDSNICACNMEAQPVQSKLQFYDTLRNDTGWTTRPEVGMKFVLENVYFNNDKHDLLPQSISSLNRLRKLLEQHPSMRIQIIGHTSSVGGYEHNVELSRKRAKQVRNYLIISGIDKSRLRSLGRGPDEPIADNATVEGQSLNRRVEIKIVDL